MSNQQQTIERIHRAFELDLFESAESGFGRYIEKYCPIGVKAEKFEQRVNHYRFNYPQNNFVTERQVAEICREYGLLAGPGILFTERIPERNLKEIEAFRLREEDCKYYPESGGQVFFNQLQRSAGAGGESVEFNRYYRNNGITLSLKSPYFGFDFEKPDWVIPLGDCFVLNPVNDSGLCELKAKVNFYGSEWLVFIGQIQIGGPLLNMDWAVNYDFPIFSKSEMITMRRICRFTLNIDADLLSKSFKYLDLSRQVCPVIVAPGTMFERSKDALEVRHGYRLRFKPEPVNSVGQPFLYSNFPVDDPIVLQPVPMGYLVVTKWGLEANIPAVQNPGAN